MMRMNDPTRSVECRRILLAEDEPGLQEAFTLTLELEGFEVVRASDGREAVTLLETLPDLIITDYMMPRMNGLKFIEHIRSRPAFDDVPILLMSAALPRDVDETIADAFLPKPVTITRLLNTVNSLLTPA
jgi:CheY-like chemotaxis protein